MFLAPITCTMMYFRQEYWRSNSNDLHQSFATALDDDRLVSKRHKEPVVLRYQLGLVSLDVSLGQEVDEEWILSGSRRWTLKTAWQLSTATLVAQRTGYPPMRSLAEIPYFVDVMERAVMLCGSMNEC